MSVPTKICLGDHGVWLKEVSDGEGKSLIHITTPQGSWEVSQTGDALSNAMSLLTSRQLLPSLISEIFFLDYAN